MTAHMGVDASTGYVHSVNATAARVRDLRLALATNDELDRRAECVGRTSIEHRERARV